MACSDFDGQVVRQDSLVGLLSKQFVCVRIQSMNGVNINLFQFDYDLTWMGFFMDANDGIYTRYGGRDAAGAESYLSQESLVATMRKVLELHKNNEVQDSRYESDGKPPRTPEDIPTMTRLMAPRKESKCIHCHDVNVAGFRHQQTQDRFSRDNVFTYPAPTVIGIQIDPDAQNKVRAIEAGSPAAEAGLKAGDHLLSSDGQRLVTFADLTRVLELTSPAGGTVPLTVERAGEKREVKIQVGAGWRKSDDPSWRSSVHVAGPGAGFWAKDLKEEEKRKHGIPPDELGLEVTHIWVQRTRKALKPKDIVVAMDGIRGDMNIRQLHARLHLNKNWGDFISFVVLRDGEEKELKVQLADPPKQWSRW